ncbi:MAG: hypothetical protein LBF16_09830, partial [Pseudomonadales bacterium]|nr:hypothetical protein [Pseudomonadales bacterium]
LRPPFVEADDKILRDTEGRTYGKFLKAAGARMFEDPHKAGAWRKVYDLSDAKAKVALEAAGIKVAKPAATTTSKAQKKASKANAAQTQAEEALEEQYAWKLFDATVQKAPTTLTAATLADVIVRLGDSSSPAVEHIIAACGLSKKLTAINDEYELQALGIKELSRLAFAVLLAEKLEYTGSVQQLESAATALKVDCKKIRAEVEAAIKSPPAMEQTSAPTKDKPTPTPALKTKAKAKAVNKPKTKKKAKATQAKKK